MPKNSVSIRGQKSKEFDPELLKKVPAIEPDYDFDMDTGVYDD